MKDPVVASDGFTYERTAIEAVLVTGNKRSPMTREPLQPNLFPNRVLRQRIQEYEEEVLSMAETVLAVRGDRAWMHCSRNRAEPRTVQQHVYMQHR